MRATRCASSDRLVMTAATCRSRSNPRNVAPPLKSTSTRFNASGGWVATRPRASVRRNSDLPEPVAPTQSPCGPMPPWAASLMSSSTGSPASETPIATRSRRRAGARLPARRGVDPRQVAEPVQSRPPAELLGPLVGRRRRRRESGASRRAHVNAATGVSRSGWVRRSAGSGVEPKIQARDGRCGPSPDRQHRHARDPTSRASRRPRRPPAATVRGVGART